MDITTLPRHARTGLYAVGWRKARTGETGPQPIWPILGGAPGDDEDDDQDDGADDSGDADDGDEDQEPDGADQLGDAGKKALDSMKAKARTERERRKAAEAELAQFKAAAAKKPVDDGSGDPPDLEQLRADARAEAKAEGLRDRALDRLEARAARKFADPEDARAHLARRVEDFIDGDHIDTEAIAEALDELLDAKPYLALDPLAGKRFKDGGDGGARPGQSPKGQLTEAELAKLTPQQIVAAKAEGRLDNLLGKTK
ncbi:hypothetical protein ACFVZR_07700 [Streptomyces sp. NPDC058316]|uniref:hypothetical protein n=1 Tax=unclassified Streptomyces TaxID=2593676 RepID=UPI0036EE13C1